MTSESPSYFVAAYTVGSLDFTDRVQSAAAEAQKGTFTTIRTLMKAAFLMFLSLSVTTGMLAAAEKELSNFKAWPEIVAMSLRVMIRVHISRLQQEFRGYASQLRLGM
ncbi:MAG: hypothetical protein ACJ74Z_19650 [Bryobacteraceae bacterium]